MCKASITGPRGFFAIYNTWTPLEEGHRCNRALLRFIAVVEPAISIIFTIEMILKLIAFYPREYLRDLLNWFDAVIVVAFWVQVLAYIVMASIVMVYIVMAYEATAHSTGSTLSSWSHFGFRCWHIRPPSHCFCRTV